MLDVPERRTISGSTEQVLVIKQFIPLRPIMAYEIIPEPQKQMTLSALFPPIFLAHVQEETTVTWHVSKHVCQVYLYFGNSSEVL